MTSCSEEALCGYKNTQSEYLHQLVEQRLVVCFVFLRGVSLLSGANLNGIIIKWICQNCINFVRIWATEHTYEILDNVPACQHDAACKDLHFARHSQVALAKTICPKIPMGPVFSKQASFVSSSLFTFSLEKSDRNMIRSRSSYSRMSLRLLGDRLTFRSFPIHDHGKSCHSSPCRQKVQEEISNRAI